MKRLLYPLLLVGAFAVTSTFVTADDGCGGTTYPSNNAPFEHEVILLVNQERREAGLPPLALNTDLRDAARYHSQDMITDDYFEHDSHDRVNGQLTLACGTFERIGNYYDLTWGGENIAAGYDTPQEVVENWMDSPDHRTNILNENFRESGVGYRYNVNAEYRHYWTHDFGSRRDLFPIIINDEAFETNSSLVALYIYGDWEEARFRNGGGAWSAWSPFDNEMQWTLTNTAGEQTVTAELRATNGSIRSVSDSIILSLPTAVQQHNTAVSTHSVPSTVILLLVLLTLTSHHAKNRKKARHNAPNHVSDKSSPI